MFKVGNYNDCQFNYDSTAGTSTTTVTGGNSFKVFGIESTITTTTIVTETFKVSEDESRRCQHAADAIRSHDVDPMIVAPPAADHSGERNRLCEVAGQRACILVRCLRARSAPTNSGLYTFAITDPQATAINGVDFGLKTSTGRPSSC